LQFLKSNQSSHAQSKLAKDLNEFKDFCHYSWMSEWDVHKQRILQNVDKYGFYIFDGNDTWYYVVQHPEWWEGKDVAMAKKTFAESGAYLFIKIADAGVEVKLAKDLEEFKDFFHYTGLPDWDVQKQDILQGFETIGIYGVNDNGAWYGIFQHPLWAPDEDGEAPDVTVTLE
jgi:hypothetical protein